MGKLRPSDQAALKKAQRAWIEFRDADCAFGAFDLRGCFIQRTDERDKQLRTSGYRDANGKAFKFAPSIANGTQAAAASRRPAPVEPQNGYDQPVTDPKATAAVVRDFRSSFEAMKTPVTIASCQLIEEVAVGVVGGNLSHGAICQVSVAGTPTRNMALCNDSGIGYFAIQAGSWTYSREWVANFVRQNCTGG